MPLPKLREKLKIAVLVPCYQRLEYTAQCLNALESSDKFLDITYFLYDDGNENPENIREVFSNFKGNKKSYHFPNNLGLRRVVISFLYEIVSSDAFDFIAKIDNDCVVPKNYFSDMLFVFEQSDVEILSPNVSPSNAAITHGANVPDLPYMPSKIVGGLWMMRTYLLKDIIFQHHDVRGLTGAFAVLKQIITEKDPVVGWARDIVVQDLGHWSGNHPEHIDSEEHKNYSNEVGRSTSWNASEKQTCLTCIRGNRLPEIADGNCLTCRRLNKKQEVVYG